MTRLLLSLILLSLPVAALPDMNVSGQLPVTLGNTQGKTVVMQTGSLTTSATTADQVIKTYTVTSGKTFYLQYVLVTPRLTTPAATASVLGAWSLESPAGTKLLTQTTTNPTTSELIPTVITFNEPQPFASGTVIRLVCTPAAATSMLWVGNFGGYER